MDNKYNELLLCIIVAFLISLTVMDICVASDLRRVTEALQTEEEPAMVPVSGNTYIYNTNITVTNSNGVAFGQAMPKVTKEPEKQSVSQPVVQEIAKNDILSQADVRLIASIVVGEAEGESEYGKRLVADTILNRIDSMRFPDTAYDVTHQAGQYSCVWNGRLNRCQVTDDICDLVQEEASNRTNTEVIFFRTGHYGTGKPLFQEGHHYFCGL